MSHYCKLGIVLFAGDFSAHLATDVRLYTNQKSKLLSQFVIANGLVPLHAIFNNNSYTYIPARSTIDHVLIERTFGHMITSYSVAQPQEVITSDHLPIHFKLNHNGEPAHHKPNPNPHINWSKCTPIHLSNYNQELEKQESNMLKAHNLDDLSPRYDKFRHY